MERVGTKKRPPYCKYQEMRTGLLSAVLLFVVGCLGAAEQLPAPPLEIFHAYDGMQRLDSFGDTNETHLHLSYRTVGRDAYMAAEAVTTPDDKMLIMFDEVVMARDETDAIAEYIGSLVTRPGLDVLEVGFGMAISSSLVQATGCARHTIVEANAGIMKRLVDWRVERQSSSAAPGCVVVPVFGFWEDALGRLRDASLDAIWFDPHPSTATVEFVQEARRLLRPGGRVSFFLSTYHEENVEPMWTLERAKLLEAGWREGEIASPRVFQGTVVDDCGHRHLSSDGPRCPRRSMWYIIPVLTRGRH